MKPRSIKQHQDTGVDTTLSAKKMSIEIPALGKIESDSGNHLVDVLSIILIIGAFFVMRKFYETT